MLYLIKSGNYLKIGSAKNIKERMKLYVTHNPDFELLDTKEGNIYDEKELQRLCKEWKYRTEWFYYNKEIIKIFKEFVPKNSEHLYKFLLVYDNKPEEEIEIDMSYKDAEQHVLDKYRKLKSIMRIYMFRPDKVCIYPDMYIQRLELENEKLKEQLNIK